MGAHVLHSSYNSSTFTENVSKYLKDMEECSRHMEQPLQRPCGERVPDVFEEQQKSTCGWRRVNNGENERLKRK